MPIDNKNNFVVYTSEHGKQFIKAVFKGLSKNAKALASLFLRQAHTRTTLQDEYYIEDGVITFYTSIIIGDVQFSSKWLEKEFGIRYSKLIDELVQAGIIYRNSSYKLPNKQKGMPGQCIIYEICPSFFAQLISKQKGDTVKAISVLNQRRIIEKSSLRDETDHPYPEIIINALRAITKRPYNRSELLNNYISLPPAFTEKEKIVKNTLARIINNIEIQSSDDLSCFYQNYTVCNTGRIFSSELGQALKAQQQRVSFIGIDYVNYDLKASQGLILLALVKYLQLDVDTSWLEKYNDYHKNDKSAFCWRVFASKEESLYKTIKSSIYSIFYGASTKEYSEVYITKLIKENNEKPKNAKKIKIPSIAEAFYESGRQNWYASFKRFLDEIRPLILIIEAVNNKLNLIEKEKIAVINPFFSFKKNNLRQFTFYNACALPFKKEEDNQRLCHILQGTESAFIHRLTALSTKYDFLVYENMHDGLITNKEIPLEAIDEAKKLVRLDCFNLIEKPL